MERGAGQRKNILFPFKRFFFLYTVDVLLLWFPFSQPQKGAGALSLQELHSLQTPELDRQVPKVTTGEGGVSRSTFTWFLLDDNFVMSLLQISPAFAPLSHRFFHFSFFVSKINTQHFRVSQVLFIISHSLYIPYGIYALKAYCIEWPPVCVRRPQLRRWRMRM